MLRKKTSVSVIFPDKYHGHVELTQDMTRGSNLLGSLSDREKYNKKGNSLIISKTKFLIVIGSVYAFLSRNWCTIT